MKMKPGIILLVLAAVIIVIIIVVNFVLKPAQPAAVQPKLVASQAPVVQMAVQADTSMPFDTVGQLIQYRFDIKNTGSQPLLGNVSVMGVSAQCPAVNTIGNLDTSLDPNETLTCTSSRAITQADLDSGSVTIQTTANVDGNLSTPVTTVVPMTRKLELIATETTAPLANASGGSVQSNSSNYTAGATIQHQVVAGEWLWQITRCYGANLKQVIKANPQLADPDQISPNTTITVPNIGSDGPIFGPPCLTKHTVEANDTWESISKKYNANLDVLKRVNPGALTSGKVLIIPLNSANY